MIVVAHHSRRGSPSPTHPALALTASRAGHPVPPSQDIGEFVEIALEASPRSAQLRIDDGPALENPYAAHVPRDNRQHDIRVSAEGHYPRVVKVRFSKDIDLAVVLQTIPTISLPGPQPLPVSPPIPAPLPTQPQEAAKSALQQLDRGSPWE
jgi:hypothetical protein